MSQLKHLLEKATQKNEMKWRVYAYDPAKDNKLVHTSELFDDINGAGIEKAELLKKNPDYTIEIVAESAQKNEDYLPPKHIWAIYYAIQDDFNNMSSKNNAKAILQNLFNKHSKALRAYNSKDLEFLKKKIENLYHLTTGKTDAFNLIINDSAQKNEDFKPGDKVSVKSYDKTGNQFLTLKNATIIKEISEKEAGQLEPAYNWKEPTGQKYYLVKLNTGSKKAVAKNDLIQESANIDVKNPGVLEVPDGKKVDELPQSHFEKLVDKKGYAEVIRALTNLEVWNKDKNKSLSSWASNMADKLKKKYRPESTQRNEADPNAEKTLITKKQTIQRLAAKLTNDNLLPQLKQFKDYVDDVYNFALKNFDESAQMNETRSYKVTVKLEVPDKMNNRDIEDYIENKVDNSNFGVYVLDVTAERA